MITMEASRGNVETMISESSTRLVYWGERCEVKGIKDGPVQPP
jgi:hypothetical protein